MEDIFKRNLLSLRQPPAAKTFSEALLGFPDWSRPRSKRLNPLAEKALQTTSFTERKQVLESLERFVEEQVAQTQNNVIQIDGGELEAKPIPAWENIPAHASGEKLQATLSLSTANLAVTFRDKIPGKIQVMFVTEAFRAWGEVAPELRGTFLDELLVGFNLKTAELFERMIKAMNLLPSEVLIYPIESGEKDLSTEVMTIARTYKPEIIVTLGAMATNKILKGNDRLSLIHGQFFSRVIDGIDSFQIVPLFHPSIIETNQNMKKTAWSDMQKIMKHLRKLP